MELRWEKKKKRKEFGLFDKDKKFLEVSEMMMMLMIIIIIMIIFSPE